MNKQLHHILCGLIAITAGLAWGAPSDLAQTPLSVTQTVRPMVLLALSNDHQLYRKAYNDYSDLDSDGVIDTTYQSGYEYYGYFDPKKCYVYSVAGYFEPTGKATLGHRCNPGISGQDSGTWSGNLLNWATMTRMDILRRVLYGGYRSIDDPARTILERVLLPTDSHAFAKVFTPTGGATEMGRHTPYSDDGIITFCNVTWATSGESQSLNTSTSHPLIRVAKGSWSMWSSGEVTECAWREAKTADTTAPWENSNSNVSPVRVGSKLYQLNARVAVCVSGWLEDNCRDYKDDSGVVHNKPIGLLQKYGENGSLRFGLMSGSYNKNLSGGVLRRKIGLIAGNTAANAAFDEINLKTGQFINTGIISTINAFRINKYSFADRKYSDCNTYGIPLCTLKPNEYCLKNGVCTNWGNPVSEIFFESLRYLAGKGAPYTPFNADDHSYFGTLTPINTWDDPMPVTEWCAKSNIIFLSTGVNSFDRDEFSSDFTDLNLTAGTNLIGAQEDIGTNLIIGGSTTGQCTAKAVTGLANAQGVCPEGPTLDGGYQVAALAHFAHTTGLRRVKDQQQKVNTQTVALARDLPRFNIPVGNNTVTLLPHMEASKDGAAIQSTAGWRVGTLQDLIVEDLTKDQSGRPVSGSLRVIWEDSTWGNDYDMDGVERIQFCVGPTACTQICNACSTPCNVTCNSSCTTSCETKYQTCRNGCSTSSCRTDCYNKRTTCNAACPATCTTTCANTCASECNPTVAENELKITTSVQQASAGNALLFGYTVAGTVSGSTPTNTKCDGAYHGDGVYREVVRTGGKNFSMLTDPQDTPSNKPTDCVRKFQAGINTARLLEHPLWYGAKYGGFIDANGNALPDANSEWDANNDGVPDRFFFADNPAQLGKSLENFLEIIATVSSSAAVVANSVTLQENTFIFQGRYDSADWSGDLVAFPVNFVDGSLSTLVWSGRSQIDIQSAAGNRRIITTNADRVANASATIGVPFAWGNTTSDDDDGIANSQKRALSGNCVDCTAEELILGAIRLDYLRGGRTHEAANGGLLRTRIHLMGDVVNSNPIYVGEPAAFYPDDLDAAPYSAFAAAQAARQHVIYVGANDGMLHAFTAINTTTGGRDAGTEIFAYVPRAVYPKLAALTASNYRDYHQAYVDSGATAGDAYLPGKASWSTILVGGLGAGGRGVYALDVTRPADYLVSAEDAATQVLWDITGDDAGFAHLGYTYGKPAIVRMPDDTYGGRWTVVFGNGYESPAGKAVLYVVDAETGTRQAEIVVDDGPDNGLSSVAPVDYNGDARVDYIYAGDLKGNLWRFEPGGNAGMMISFAGDPLFNDGVGSVEGAVPVTTAITVRPEVVSHPVRGVVVLFGTGSYYRKGDGGNSDPKNDRIPHPSIINAFYGIWDRRDGTSNIERSHLLKQQVLGKAVAGTFDVRVTTDNPINWHLGTGKPTTSDPPTHLGWYLELRQPLDGAGEGELQVTNPQARGGRIIFTTLIPADTTTALCDFGGDGWLMELNALTGGRMTEVVFDLNSDTYFNAADLVTVREHGTDVKRAPSGKKSLVGIIQEPAIISAGTKEYKYTSGAREAAIEVTLENPGDPERGRRAWMQLH